VSRPVLCIVKHVVLSVDWKHYPMYPVKAAPDVMISGVVPLLCAISREFGGLQYVSPICFARVKVWTCGFDHSADSFGGPSG